MPFDPTRGNNNLSGYTNPYMNKATEPNRKKKGSGILIAVIMVVLLILGVAIGGMFFVNKGKTPTPDTNTDGNTDDSEYIEIELFDR